MTGSSKLRDFSLVEEKLGGMLSKLKDPMLVMMKGDGASHFTELYAFRKRIARQVFHPDFRKHRQDAVSVTREEMLATKGVRWAIAFLSRGDKKSNEESESLLRRAPKHGVKVRIVRFK